MAIVRFRVKRKCHWIIRDEVHWRRAGLHVSSMECHYEPFSLLILVEKIMVVLVSFQFHSISAFEVWTFGLLECTFLLGIPFGHSLGMYLSKCPLFGVLFFWATREPRQSPRREWRGLGNCGSVPSGYFVVQQLDLYRVGHADLEGQRFVSCFFGSIKVLHHPKHRAFDFIDITSE